MTSTCYLIRKDTLCRIADSVRRVKGLSCKIPCDSLDEALCDKPIRSCSEAIKSYYKIKRQTLVDIADTVREQEGSTEEIKVIELSDRILTAYGFERSKLRTPHIYLSEGGELIKLATPVIYLSETGGNEDGVSTTAILGKAILGYAILGNSVILPKLGTPIIYIESEEPGEEKPKLATPSIYLTVVEEEEEIPNLATPYIYIEVIEDEEEVTPKLATPEIYLEEETAPKLSTPEIYITLNAPALAIQDESGLLEWNEVEGAHNYIIDLSAFGLNYGGLTVDSEAVETTVFDLQECIDRWVEMLNSVGSFAIEGGYYPVKVKACFERIQVGEDSLGAPILELPEGYRDSEWSNTIEFYYMN